MGSRVLALVFKLSLMVFLALGAQPAQAKLIAIVFDTSGSMNDRFRLPSFGMQMLAATIDGRAGEDRVWALNFNAYANTCGGQIPEAATIASLPCNLRGEILKFEVTSDASHANLLGQLEATFTEADVGTPYGPLEIMLDEISREIQDGEEAILIVVTDGAYEVINQQGDTVFDNGAYIAQFQRSFAEYRNRILNRGGSLRAEFLFIDSTGGNEGKVREQGVRDTLLEVFNGDAREGAWHVTGARPLWTALTEITARVNDTDREAQAAFIDFEGTDAIVRSPLSISRMVIVSTATAPTSPARLQSTTIDVPTTDDRRLAETMGQGDRLFSNLRLGGAVEHLWFQRAVPPGEYRLTFDRPLNDDTFLLFETAAVAELKIFDDTGAEVTADANGNHVLFIGTDYTFQTQVVDGVTTPTPVDLDALPASLAMFLSLEGGSIAATNSMTLDRVADRGVYQWTPTTRDEIRAASRVSAGILSPESVPLSLVILDATAKVTISPITSAEDCANCSANQVTSSVTGGSGGDVPVGTFTITTEADRDGGVVIDGEGFPVGYAIIDENGNEVPFDTPIPFGSEDTQTFTITRPAGVDIDDLADGGTDIEITVTPTQGWTGQPVDEQTRVLLTPPGMGMALVDVSQPITPGTVDGLLVPGGELLRGQFSGQFSLIDLLEAPDPSLIDERVSVAAPGLTGRLIGFEPAFAGGGGVAHSLEVRPSTSYWCLCFLGIGNVVRGGATYDATVSYTHEVSGVVLQTAQALLPMSFPIAMSQMSISCLLNLLYLLLFAMFIRGLFALVTTHRFPKGSVMEITDGASMPRFKRLDKGNSVWWKAWFALFTGNPNEKRTIEGLKIEATRKGAKIDVAKSAPPWEMERMGESFAELKENNPKKDVYTLIWGDRLENIHRRQLSMRFKKKSSDS